MRVAPRAQLLPPPPRASSAPRAPTSPHVAGLLRQLAVYFGEDANRADPDALLRCLATIVQAAAQAAPPAGVAKGKATGPWTVKLKV